MREHVGIYRPKMKNGKLSPNYYLSFVDQHGEHIRISAKTPSLTTARNRLAKVKDEVTCRIWKQEPKKKILFSQMVEERREIARSLKLKSFSKESAKLDYWLGVFGERPISSISLDDIKTARKELLEGRGIVETPLRKNRSTSRSTVTVNRYLATLRQVFSLAVAKDFMDKSPFKKTTVKSELFGSEEYSKRIDKYLTEGQSLF